MRNQSIALAALVLVCDIVVWVTRDRRDTFDRRFDNAEQRIQDMAQSIDADLDADAKNSESGE